MSDGLNEGDCWVGVALAVSVLPTTINVGNCPIDNSLGRAGVVSAGLTLSYDADGRMFSNTRCVTIDTTEVFNSVVVILKVEIETTTEIGTTGIGAAGAVTVSANVITSLEVANVLGSTVRVFVSSIVWVTVRKIDVVAADNGSDGLPSMSTTE